MQTLATLGTDLSGSSARCVQASGMNSGEISPDIERKFSRPREFFENFGRKSAENRTQSHAPQHADARQKCLGSFGAVSKLDTTRRHGFRRDLTLFRTQIFAAAQNFRKFRSRIARNLTRRSLPTFGTDVADLRRS